MDNPGLACQTSMASILAAQGIKSLAGLAGKKICLPLRKGSST